MKNLKEKTQKAMLLSIMICAFVISCGFASPSQKVYDDADLLTESEEAKIQELCLEYIEKTQADIVIHTTNTIEDKTILSYADDYYDYNGFGYDKEMGDGLVFVINMHDRELAISTSGKIRTMLSDNQTDDMISKIAPYLTDGEYYEGCEAFLACFDNEYNYSLEEGKRKEFLCNIAEVLIALVLGVVVTWIAYSGHNTKMTVNGYTYAKEHKCEVRQRSDIYTNTTRTVRVIESSNSSSGGRIGSSGNRHGGSSGKF